MAGRLSPRIGTGGLRLIDDSYNANPDSVRAAIETLVGLPGRHWLVLGDLGELGPESEELHRGLGEDARAAGVDALYTVGKLSALACEAFGAGGRHFSDQASLLSDLRRCLGPDDLVLVKGSRLSAMERVVDALCGRSAT
jgi:UDP-N-acetylmuramoyl-tripeptide--D-alanyl-D-alanine ligase